MDTLKRIFTQFCKLSSLVYKYSTECSMDLFFFARTLRYVARSMLPVLCPLRLWAGILRVFASFPVLAALSPGISCHSSQKSVRRAKYHRMSTGFHHNGGGNFLRRHPLWWQQRCLRSSAQLSLSMRGNHWGMLIHLLYWNQEVIACGLQMPTSKMKTAVCYLYKLRF